MIVGMLRFVLWSVAAAAIGWAALALYYASGLTTEWARIALALVPPLAAFIAVWRLRSAAALIVIGLIFAGVLGWWLSIAPSNDRDWQPEVAKLAYATFDGDKVTVHNIRDFEYRTETDFTPRYIDRTFDLNDIRTIDVVSSYWSGELIAHLFLSFGFAHGERIAVSIETRKEKGQAYSTLAGFFRQYEIYYVVATERDLIGVRTNHRRPPEDVYVYRTDAQPAGARRLFTDYLRAMNELVKTPEFYNTLTTNCTTAIVMHVDATSGAIPSNWKVLVSGLFPEYLYELGYLDESMPFRELKQRSHVNARADGADGADDFSARIRVGQPIPRR